jgi:hypothetical protein
VAPLLAGRERLGGQLALLELVVELEGVLERGLEEAITLTGWSCAKVTRRQFRRSST